MGSFNVKGFHSGLDLETGDPAILILGAFQRSPYKYEKKYSHAWSHGEGATGIIEPIAPPIRCEYYDYGRVTGIVRDEVVLRIEEVLGSPIEEILEIVYNVTWDKPVTVEDALRYEEFKERLGLDEYEKDNLDLWLKYFKNRIPLEEWIESSRSRNYELTRTIDHAWVYDTMKTLYPWPVRNDYVGFLKTNAFSAPNDDFYKFLKKVKVTQSTFSGQDFPWDEYKIYHEACLEFIKEKLKPVD